jgi:hypothetical protein
LGIDNFDYRDILDVMDNQSNQSNGGKQKMIMTGFRVWPADLKRAKEKAGLVDLAKYLRTLFLMWLNGEIQVTEDDVKRHNPK